MVANSSYPMLVGDREAVARIGHSAMAQQGLVSCFILDSVGGTVFFQGERMQGDFELLRKRLVLVERVSVQQANSLTCKSGSPRS